MSADLTLVGKDVVRGVLGPQWSESGRIFDLFGPGIGVMLLCGTVGWIHLSIGKPGRWLRWTVFQLLITACLFLIALHWGPEGIAAAWSFSFWILVIPGFWYAGRPIGFGVMELLAPTWRYLVAAIIAGLATAAMIRGSVLWGTPSETGAALGAICIISALFLTLYLGMVILLHRGLAPLRQLTSLLRELAPSSRPVAETVGG